MKRSFKFIVIGIIFLAIIGPIVIAFTMKYSNKKIEQFKEIGTIANMNYQIYNDYKQGTYDYTKKGYYVDTLNQPNAPYYFIITMGAKNTGGYSIEIVDIKIDEDNNVKVIVQENVPKEGEVVTMAFTYPAVCLELSGYPKSIEIKNTSGEVFKQLN